MGLIKQYSRISHHTISAIDVPTGSPIIINDAPFTVPPGEDFTDGTWYATDLALSEIGVLEQNKTAWIRINDEVREIMTASAGVLVPGNSTQIIFNLDGELTSDPGLIYDPEGNRSFQAIIGTAGIQLGSAQYGNFIIPGAGLWYDGGDYFQGQYVDPNYIAPDGKVSGFYAGDISTLGGIDFSWTAGYRNTDNSEAYNIAGEPGEITIVARDTLGDGIEANITDLDWNIRLENTGAKFRVTGSNGNPGISVNDANVVKISDAYELPALSGPADYMVISDGTDWVYSPQPRYSEYFDVTSGSITTFAVVDTWTKLETITVQGLSNNGLVHTNNRIENTGAPGIFKATAFLSASIGVPNQRIHMAYFLDEGLGFGIVPSSEQIGLRMVGVGDDLGISIQCLVELQTGSYLEIWIKNVSNTNSVTCGRLNNILTELK